MIRRLLLLDGIGFDPYRNLATERLLMKTVPEDALTLYLWQNERTVVIGRNQNARKECRVEKLLEDGGRLARRPTGGGAVFHDLGNLNFSFLATSENYDAARQTRVVLEACRSLGITAEATGRNDLTADGRKFSGCAYCHHEGRACHHGTLLVCADTERMDLYLRPDGEKLRSRGVESVRTRVVNLTELNPALTVVALKRALIAAFEAEYGLRAEILREANLDADAVAAQIAEYQSWDWLFGREMPFDYVCEGRFPWGGLRLEMQTDGGIVQSVSAFTDAMDADLAGRLESALAGCRFDPEALCERVGSLGLPECADVCTLIREQDL